MGYAEEGDGNFKWDGLRNPPYEAGILANTCLILNWSPRVLRSSLTACIFSNTWYRQAIP